MLDRYAYVRNNPLNYVDPSGLYARFVCGMGQNCESGGISEFRFWVTLYWQRTGQAHSFEDLMWDLKSQTDDAIIRKYDVAFMDTSDELPDVKAAVEDLAGLLEGRNDLTLLVGFSFGGLVVHDYLWAINKGPLKDTNHPSGFDTILIQPAIRVFPFGGNLFDAWRYKEWRYELFGFLMGHWTHPQLSANDVQGKIATVNDPGSVVGGTVWGARDFARNDCSGNLGRHCGHNDPMTVNKVYDYINPVSSVCPYAP